MLFCFGKLTSAHSAFHTAYCLCSFVPDLTYVILFIFMMHTCMCAHGRVCGYILSLCLSPSRCRYSYDRQCSDRSYDSVLQRFNKLIPRGWVVLVPLMGMKKKCWLVNDHREYLGELWFACLSNPRSWSFFPVTIWYLILISPVSCPSSVNTFLFLCSYSVSRSHWWCQWCSECVQGSSEAFQKEKQSDWTIFSEKGLV